MKQKYPDVINRAIMQFHMFTVMLVATAVSSMINGRPVRTVLILYSLAFIPEIFCLIYKRKINTRGFANWRFRVLANAYTVFDRKRARCVLAVPLKAPYTDKMFEILLNDKIEPPKIGSFVAVCVPEDVRIIRAKNRYIMPWYYDIRFENDPGHNQRDLNNCH